MHSPLWTKFSLVALIAVLLAGLSFAQTSNGTIAGVVTDPSGAAITNAKVVATSKATGEVRTSQTNTVGAYRFESVIPGPYTITVSATSFATVTINNLNVVASVVTAANAELKPGSTTEVVNVEAQGETLQTESGDVTHTVDQKSVETLPNGSLNAYAMALTLPGVVTVSGDVDMTNGAAYSVNGTRPRSNNFLIEGQDNNDSGIKGQGIMPENVDAVKEVSVLTNSYAAEFGNAGGSVNNLIYKTGSNQFHGAMWDRLSNSSLDANDHYNNRNDIQKSKYRDNVWGFDVGGPIKKDKLFFFVSHQWDWYRATRDGSEMPLPTQAGHDTLVNLLNNPNTTAGQAQRINAMLQAYGNNRGSADQIYKDQGKVMDYALGPDANGFDRGIVEVGPYWRSGVADKTNAAEFLAKGDYIISPNDTVNLRYLRSAQTVPYATTGLPGFDTYIHSANHNAGITYTHIFTPTIVNELRVSYGRIGNFFDYRPETYANPSFGVGVSVTGLTGWGANPTYPQSRFHNTYQYQDALSWQKGNHSFKFGADVQNVRVRDQIPFNQYGLLGYAAAGNISAIANYVDDFGGRNAGASRTFGNPTIYPEMWAQAYYFQDSWKIKPNFTLTYGIRYENNGTPANSLQYPAVDPKDLNPADYPQRIKEKRDNNNFGPRVGFAYTPHFWKSVFGDDKTVFRGGFGVFYDGIFTNILDNTAAASPNAVSPGVTSVRNAANPRGTANWSQVYASLSPVQNPAANTNPISKDLISPVTYQWNFNIERELPAKFAVTVGYVGTRGLHLFTNTDANPIDPETGERVYPNRGRIIMRDNEGDSIYHGLNVDLNRRFSHGLQARVAYTWSKMIDDSSEIFTGGNYSSYPIVQYPNKRGMYDRGLSAYDRRHRIAISYVYDVPKVNTNSFQNKLASAVVGGFLNGWGLSGTTAFQSGAPGNVFVGTDINGDGISNDRPTLGNPNAPISSWAWGYTDPAAGFQWCEGTEWANTYDPCNPVDPKSVHWLVPEAGIGKPFARNGYSQAAWTQDWTFAAGKTFKIHEQHELEFKAEMFNPFNHGNTSVPDLTLLTGTSWDFDNNKPGTATFGDKNITSSGNRSIRFLMKYKF